MKKLVALLTLFTAASVTFAVETAKAKPVDKPKTETKKIELCGDDACCDDDAMPAADAKTAKATDKKPDATKKDAAPKTVAKSDKK